MHTLLMIIAAAAMTDAPLQELPVDYAHHVVSVEDNELRVTTRLSARATWSWDAAGDDEKTSALISLASPLPPSAEVKGEGVTPQRDGTGALVALILDPAPRGQAVGPIEVVVPLEVARRDEKVPVLLPQGTRHRLKFKRLRFVHDDTLDLSLELGVFSSRELSVSDRKHIKRQIANPLEGEGVSFYFTTGALAGHGLGGTITDAEGIEQRAIIFGGGLAGAIILALIALAIHFSRAAELERAEEIIASSAEEGL